MAETRLRKAGEDQLTEVEIETLRERFATESQQAVTISALAEASGMDREAVREHLRQIRTEQAFRHEAKPVPSAERPNWYWAAVGGVVLLLAGGITFQRLQAVQPVEYSSGALSVPSSAVANAGEVRTRPRGEMLPHYSDGRGGRLPVGFQVVVSIPGRQQAGNGNYSVEKVPGPYEAQRDLIAQAIEDLANTAYEESAKFPNQVRSVKPPFMDSMQNTFTVGEGEFHYGVSGWAGRIAGKVKFPVGVAERVQIRKAVEGMFATELAAQKQALGAPPKQGIVSPPPGYRIQFGGRRMDSQEGPSLAFAPVPVGLVQQRLEAALANAAARDAAVPEGRWSQNAQSEGKIATPASFVGSIEGPGGPVPFDIPSRPASALRRGIRDVAARAAAQIEAVNAKSGSILPTIEANGTVRN